VTLVINVVYVVPGSAGSPERGDRRCDVAKDGQGERQHDHQWRDARCGKNQAGFKQDWLHDFAFNEAMP
jgi:hypothetical protein